MCSIVKTLRAIAAVQIAQWDHLVSAQEPPCMSMSLQVSALLDFVSRAHSQSRSSLLAIRQV